jgi:hypothetical protein
VPGGCITGLAPEFGELGITWLGSIFGVVVFSFAGGRTLLPEPVPLPELLLPELMLPGTLTPELLLLGLVLPAPLPLSAGLGVIEFVAPLSLPMSRAPSVGGAGFFIIDSVPELPEPEVVPLAPDEEPLAAPVVELLPVLLSGANVDVGFDVEVDMPDCVPDEVVPEVFPSVGAAGRGGSVCIDGETIMVETAPVETVGTRSRPVQGSKGTFITIVRGVR